MVESQYSVTRRTSIAFFEKSPACVGVYLRPVVLFLKISIWKHLYLRHDIK
jgi:hypothetical protein